MQLWETEGRKIINLIRTLVFISMWIFAMIDIWRFYSDKNSFERKVLSGIGAIIELILALSFLM